jgi:hypothetical protein
MVFLFLLSGRLVHEDSDAEKTGAFLGACPVITKDFPGLVDEPAGLAQIQDKVARNDRDLEP